DFKNFTCWCQRRGSLAASSVAQLQTIAQPYGSAF
ncbi:hypothetical protein FOMG_19438, partial [Fusarium oxysporum f. sp. melonis 26406]